ncbi:MAG: hypothetical protein JWP89_5978 [Schlesneria sp.]|nr:hypothetical protein [Schlesneria sp.]
MELVHPKLESRKMNRYVLLALIAVPLIAIGGVLTWLSLQDQNNHRVAKNIMAAKGTADFRYLGPKWIGENVRPYLPGMVRVCNVHLIEPDIPEGLLTEIGALRQVDRLDLGGTSITDDGFEKLKSLSNVKRLIIRSTKVTDAGLAHLKGMPLVELDAADTQITDAGLESLKGQSKLTLLSLTKTKTTPAGRATLRKALPECEISPNP